MMSFREDIGERNPGIYPNGDYERPKTGYAGSPKDRAIRDVALQRFSPDCVDYRFSPVPSNHFSPLLFEAKPQIHW